MRVIHSGLRSSHPTTRFGPSPSTRRERQLGLRRAPHALLTALPQSHARAPLLASLRQAARSTSNIESSTRGAVQTQTKSRLTPTVSFNWSNGTAGSASRRPRPRSAAPWRG